MDEILSLFSEHPALWFALAAAALAGGALGGLTSARVWRRLRAREAESAREPGPLPGINYILTNDTDAAIEELTRALAASRGSVETYLALGALFRSKGEVERAIRLHQSVIARKDLDEQTRTQASFELGLDYRRAGLLERAIEAFRDVIARDPDAAHAYRELQRLYEESGEWPLAYDMQRQLQKRTGERADAVLSHHLVEIGRGHEQKGELEEAGRVYRKALSIDASSVHAALALGRLLVREGNPREAVSQYERAMAKSPALSAAIYPRLEEAYRDLGEEPRYERLLREQVVQDETEIFARLALAQWLRRRGRTGEAALELHRALEQRPDFVEARKELGEVLRTSGSVEELSRAYQDLLDAVVRPMRSFQCRQCGYETAELQWKCPQCQRWDTIAHKRFRRERRRRLRVA